MSQKKELLVETLVKMLTNKETESNSIKDVLLLLCDEFAFDGAFIYEADWNHKLLQLTEGVGAYTDTQNAPQFFQPDLYHGVAQEQILWLDWQTLMTPEEAQVLSVFRAQTMVTYFLKDENGLVYGLIALCNTQEKSLMEEAAKNSLSTALLTVAQNITIRNYQNRLRFAKTALEGIMDNTGIDIYVNDFYAHDILYVNESMAKLYGGKDKFDGKKCWQVLFPGSEGQCEFCPQKKLIDEDGNPTKVYTWDYKRALDGAWFRVFSAAFNWADGRLAHVVSSVDITDNKRNEELIHYMAHYDALTNLPNRRMLVSDCERRINQKSEKLAYILFFDIDGFKNINDSFGHDAGDELLIELGVFFTGIPMLKNLTYRNGGDEFVAMLQESITEDQICELATFIQARFREPWKLKNQSVMCGISIGAAKYPEDGTTAEELLRKADQAMYRVKKGGGGGLCFAKDNK